MNVTEKHLLKPVVFHRSPNSDARIGDIDITMVVIHCISLRRGSYGTGLPAQLFLNAINFDEHPDLVELRDYRVSAHLLIERTGATTQFVPFNERAWHAGESVWQGREDCNDFSIGIELEGTDDSPFEDSQYTVLIDILVALLSRYPTLSLGNIVGHNEVAVGRKTDPGVGFDWKRLLTSVISELHREQTA